MKRKHLSSLAALALAAYCGLAHAGFEVQDGVKKPAVAVAGLAQVGSPSSAPTAARGMARDISLLVALKQIVPQGQGWRAKKAGSLNMDQPVSWTGKGRAWTEVLGELAQANHFSATVDWDRREVTVSAAAAGSHPSAAAVVPVAASAASAPLAALANAKPLPPPAPPVKSWTMEPAKTLRENVEAWGKSAGWNVSWAGVDYPITSSFALKGEFDDENAGPMAQLAKAYETAAQPLTFQFFTNKVLRVENATFRQLSVPDQAQNPRAAH
jgi:hypothetical protein